MTAATSTMTNPGRSENLQKSASLADAIAANLTAARQEAEPPPSPQQPEPRPEPAQPAPEPVAEPEPTPEPEAAESTAEGNPPDATEPAYEAPERFTLHDFAEAAEIDVDSLVKRLEVEVTGKGGAEKANLEDVLAGYRWNSANTQRAQELAEQRKQLEARITEIQADHEKVNVMLGAQFQGVEAQEAEIQRQYESVDWNALRARQDGSFADAEAQFRQARDRVEAEKKRLAGSWVEAQESAKELATRQQAEAAPRVREQLLEMVPEWRDDTRAESELKEITSYVSETFGIAPEEQSKVNDPRTIAAFRRLWVLEQQASRASLAEKKVKAVPRALKPGQQSGQQDGREQAKQKLARRLRSSGKATDLAALLLQQRRT